MNTWSPPTHKRMIVPDVARGLALLGIALANASVMWFAPVAEDPAYFYGGSTGSTLDSITIFITAITAHVRGLPMFSTLLGFGVGLIALSLWKKGFPESLARRTLMRRYGFLALFGFVHLFFIFPGDIMFYYGIAAIALAMMITLKDKTLKIIAGVLLGFNAIGGLAMTLPILILDNDEAASIASSMITTVESSSIGSFIWENFKYFLLSLLNFPVYIFGYVPLMIIGFLWARNGVLANVDQHKKQLVIWCAIGVAVSVVFGGFMAATALMYESMRWSLIAIMLNTFVGVFTGPGILAALALALNSVQKKIDNGAATPLWVAIPAALGKRSMSGYVMQSILFAIISYGFLLNLGHHSGAFIIACYATGVWLVTLIIAWILEIKNIQGPLEWVHRRLAYGPSMKPVLPQQLPIGAPSMNTFNPAPQNGPGGFEKVESPYTQLWSGQPTPKTNPLADTPDGPNPYSSAPSEQLPPSHNNAEPTRESQSHPDKPTNPYGW